MTPDSDDDWEHLTFHDVYNTKPSDAVVSAAPTFHSSCNRCLSEIDSDTAVGLAEILNEFHQDC